MYFATSLTIWLRIYVTVLCSRWVHRSCEVCEPFFSNAAGQFCLHLLLHSDSPEVLQVAIDSLRIHLDIWASMNVIDGCLQHAYRPPGRSGGWRRYASLFLFA